MRPAASAAGCTSGASIRWRPPGSRGPSEKARAPALFAAASPRFTASGGQRGGPRNKPPFPTQAGLFGKPTLVNNVETLVNVLGIVQDGGPAFAAVGTPQSSGPKLFCVSGRVARPGVYEVPFGTTLREIIALAGG